MAGQRGVGAFHAAYSSDRFESFEPDSTRIGQGRTIAICEGISTIKALNDQFLMFSHDREARAMSLAFLLLIGLVSPTLDEDWVELAGSNGLKAWKTPTGQWADVGSVALDPKNPRLIATESGMGILVNGKLGRTNNLYSKEEYGDVECHIEFMVPKGSNAGVKFEGLYEVQIYDSYGVKKPSASDCGGVYPRAELLPTYHHIDEGYPPKVNACKPPGEWQTLDVTFLAPKFDASGKKTSDAKFVKVVLNGETVQENLSIPCPTGHAWTKKEIAKGPLFLQADHGPVAFRSVKVRRLESGETKK